MLGSEHFLQVGVPQESRSHEFLAKLSWQPEELWLQTDELLRRLRPLCFHNAALNQVPVADELLWCPKTSDFSWKTSSEGLHTLCVHDDSVTDIE